MKHFIAERAEVALVLGRERGRFGSGLEHLYGCLRRLALVEPARDSGAAFDLEEIVESAAASGPRADTNYLILLTTAARGSIPPKVWRRTYVIYL